MYIVYVDIDIPKCGFDYSNVDKCGYYIPKCVYVYTQLWITAYMTIPKCGYRCTQMWIWLYPNVDECGFALKLT